MMRHSKGLKQLGEGRNEARKNFVSPRGVWSSGYVIKRASSLGDCFYDTARQLLQSSLGERVSALQLRQRVCNYYRNATYAERVLLQAVFDLTLKKEREERIRYAGRKAKLNDLPGEGRYDDYIAWMAKATTYASDAEIKALAALYWHRGIRIKIWQRRSGWPRSHLFNVGYDGDEENITVIDFFHSGNHYEPLYATRRAAQALPGQNPSGASAKAVEPEAPQPRQQQEGSKTPKKQRQNAGSVSYAGAKKPEWLRGKKHHKKFLGVQFEQMADEINNLDSQSMREKLLLFATHNIGTAGMKRGEKHKHDPLQKLEEYLQGAYEQGHALVGIQETNFCAEVNRPVGHYWVYGPAAHKAADGSYRLGAAVAVRLDIAGCIVSYDSPMENMARVVLSLNETTGARVQVISSYMPHDTSPIFAKQVADGGMGPFEEHMETLLAKLKPGKNLSTIILSDTNSRIGQVDAHKHPEHFGKAVLMKTSCPRGKRLIDMCVNHDLVASLTMQKSSKFMRLVTHKQRETSSGTMIDHIFISGDLFRSAHRETRVMPGGRTSNHFPVVACLSFAMSSKRKKRSTAKTAQLSYNRGALHTDFVRRMQAWMKALPHRESDPTKYAEVLREEGRCQCMEYIKQNVVAGDGSVQLEKVALEGLQKFYPPKAATRRRVYKKAEDSGVILALRLENELNETEITRKLKVCAVERERAYFGMWKSITKLQLLRAEYGTSRTTHDPALGDVREYLIPLEREVHDDLDAETDKFGYIKPACVPDVNSVSTRGQVVEFNTYGAVMADMSISDSVSGARKRAYLNKLEGLVELFLKVARGSGADPVATWDEYSQLMC